MDANELKIRAKKLADKIRSQKWTTLHEEGMAELELLVEQDAISQAAFDKETKLQSKFGV